MEVADKIQPQNIKLKQSEISNEAVVLDNDFSCIGTKTEVLKNQKLQLQLLGITIVEAAKTIGTGEKQMYNYFNQSHDGCLLNRRAIFLCLNTLINKKIKEIIEKQQKNNE